MCLDAYPDLRYVFFVVLKMFIVIMGLPLLVVPIFCKPTKNNLKLKYSIKETWIFAVSRHFFMAGRWVGQADIQKMRCAIFGLLRLVRCWVQNRDSRFPKKKI